MKEIARVTVNLAALRQGKGVGPFAHGLPVLHDDAKSDPARAELAELLAMHDRCTVVYLACGSCGTNCAIVEYYCTSGGSKPDFVERVKC